MNPIIEAYQKNSMPLSQEDLVKKHLPMVKRIAHHLMGRLPKTILVDDLIQAGLMGLLEAAGNFDASRGASFETYAGIRIRGTMLDEVRRNDWLPRSVYRNNRMITSAIQSVENELGRDARDHEVAAKLGMGLAEYHALLRDTSVGQIYGFEDVGLDDDLMAEGFASKILGPVDDVERQRFLGEITVAIDKLPEREKLVLSLYYDEQLNLKEIGQVLEVSESRVCQIHSQAMCRIKARMTHWDRFDG